LAATNADKEVRMRIIPTRLHGVLVGATEMLAAATTKAR
jgi:hypothetical protein